MFKWLEKIILILSLLFLYGCGSSGSNSNSNESEDITEDSDQARREGYTKGYDDGYNAGYGWCEYGVYYDDGNNYQTYNAQSSYKNGYRDGYGEGYEVGESEQKGERERARLSDWHNWESEDVDGVYVLLDGVKNDDEAQYYADEYYDGEYICEFGDYYAKKHVSYGEYEITLGSKVSSKLYRISGGDLYIHFKWLPDVSWGDEGVLDGSGSFSTFYKKPD